METDAEYVTKQDLKEMAFKEQFELTEEEVRMINEALIESRYDELKRRNRITYQRILFYLMITLLIGITLLMAIHWLAKAFLIILFLAVALTVRALDEGCEIPDDIPMNREEEILQEELERRRR